MKKALYLAPFILLTSAFSNTAQAKGLNYNMASGSYLNNENGDSAFSFSGTKDISEYLFWGASYSSHKGTIKDSYYFDDEEVNQTQVIVGIGGHVPITRTTDVYGTLSYARIESDIENHSGLVEANGKAIQIGIRSMLTRNVELFTSLSAVGVEDADTASGFQIGFAYYLDKSFSVGLIHNNVEDVSSYGLTARLHY